MSSKKTGTGEKKMAEITKSMIMKTPAITSAFKVNEMEAETMFANIRTELEAYVLKGHHHE